jgi:CheY-like chemotaxis protein
MRADALIQVAIGLAVVTLVVVCLATTRVYAKGGSESSPMNLTTSNQAVKFKHFTIDAVTLPVVAGDDIRFTVLTGENDLPSESVYSIARDAQGFLWFATGNGLSRYDGYSFRDYRFDRGNPNSLTNNTVTASVFADQRDEILAVGIDDFVRKPFRAAELYACMSKHLGVEVLNQGARAAQRQEVKLTSSMLGALSEGLRSELEEALECLDAELIHADIQRLAEHDESLKDALQGLAANFDYPAILRALRTPTKRRCSRSKSTTDRCGDIDPASW